MTFSVILVEPASFSIMTLRNLSAPFLLIPQLVLNAVFLPLGTATFL